MEIGYTFVYKIAYLWVFDKIAFLCSHNVFISKPQNIQLIGFNSKKTEIFVYIFEKAKYMYGLINLFVWLNCGFTLLSEQYQSILLIQHSL